MEFDKSKVYTALNAEEVKVGSKVLASDNLASLRSYVEKDYSPHTIKEIKDDNWIKRFLTEERPDDEYALVYLISEPEEENWIVYLNRRNTDGNITSNYYLTACRSDLWERVQKDYGAKVMLYSGTEKECEDWYIPRRHLADIIAQWEDGKEIQMYIENGYVSNRKGWVDVANPSFSPDSEYRVKPELLKWTDLKIGDVLKNKNTNETRMVTGITSQADSVCLADCYTNDLSEWEKV